MIETSNLQYTDEMTMLLQSNLIEDEPSMEALSSAMDAWRYIRDERRLSHVTLRTAHGILMESRGSLADKYKGSYRTIPVWIAGREAPLALSVPREMRRLIDHLNDRRNVPVSDQARAIHAKQLHIEFEHIHPFVDGNGRLGRIVYNWHRLHLGLPIDIIDSQKRRAYYDWFTEGE